MSVPILNPTMYIPSEKIDPAYICHVCRNVLRNPVQIMNCYHVFCMECITQWSMSYLTLSDHVAEPEKGAESPCPTCQTPFSLNEVISLPILEAIIKRFDYKCPYACHISVRLSSVETHINKCPNAPVKCPHSLCPVTTVRYLLPMHVENCPYRIHLCNHCHLSFFSGDMRKHTRVCHAVSEKE